MWSVEEIPHKTIVAPSDEQAEAIFRQTISRDPVGRFGVALPFKTDVVPNFVDSKAIADRRLLALERRLSHRQLHQSLEIRPFQFFIFH